MRPEERNRKLSHKAADNLESSSNPASRESSAKPAGRVTKPSSKSTLFGDIGNRDGETGSFASLTRIEGENDLSSPSLIDPYQRIANAMDEIIYELSAESLTNRKYQTSLARREYKISQRKDYAQKKHDLSTITRAKKAVSGMSDAAVAYRDFCQEMTAEIQREEAVMEKFGELRGEFKDMEKAFVASAKEMVLVNERFCKGSQPPTRGKMHLTDEWRALREEVMGYYVEEGEDAGLDEL